MTIHLAIADVLTANDRKSMHEAVAALLRQLPTPSPVSVQGPDNSKLIYEENKALSAENVRCLAEINRLEREAEDLREMWLDALKGEKNLLASIAVLEGELQGLRGFVRVPEPAQDNIKDEPVPADDETDAPEIAPLVEEQDAVAIADVIAPASAPSQPSFESTGRLPVTQRQASRQAFRLAPDVEIMVTASIAKVATAIRAGSCSWRDIVATGVASTEGSAMAAVSKLRHEITKQTGGRWAIRSVNKLWSFAMTAEETPQPGQRPTAQSEGIAGECPDQDDAVRQADGDSASVDPLPAADDGEIKDREAITAAVLPVQPPPVLPGDPAWMRNAPAESVLVIPPGKLIAVCVKTRRVATPQGIYKVDGAPLAKALHALARINDDQVLGLDTIARIAGWKNADVAKTALSFESKRLGSRGVELWMDRFNARLRAGENGQ